ncbi:MAG: SprT-like domain-containing protein [Bacteroidetes bacterium]|nr:SprT-like domain-containing protein [Bacteroidota bacterium]
MKKEQLLHILHPFLPDGTHEYAVELLVRHSVQLHIKKPRSSKYGDYRPPMPGERHRISLNKDLNPYAFLVTFMHEMAHLVNHETHKGMVSPHGMEWKRQFQEISKPMFERRVLPADVHQALGHYLSNPKASSCTSPLLFKTLRKYDLQNDWVLVEEILPHTRFSTPDGKVFVKQKKNRTRYTCIEESTGKMYLVPALMQCKPVV